MKQKIILSVFLPCLFICGVNIALAQQNDVQKKVNDYINAYTTDALKLFTK